MTPIEINYTQDGKGNIVLPSSAPFDGTPVLIHLSSGWVEAWWESSHVENTIEGPEYSGWEWVCLDDKFTAELEDADYYLPLPEIKKEGP